VYLVDYSSMLPFVLFLISLVLFILLSWVGLRFAYSVARGTQLKDSQYRKLCIQVGLLLFLFMFVLLLGAAFDWACPPLVDT
jgi:ABC-type Fe3+ transport system permease subunit